MHKNQKSMKEKVFLFILVIGLIFITQRKGNSQCALSQLMQSQGYSFTNIGSKSFQSLTGITVPVYGKQGDIQFTSPLTETQLLTNVTDSELNTLEIYPNPVIDYLNIKSATGIVSRIRMTDVQGKVVIKEHEYSKPLDMSHLQPGLYYLHISGTGVTISHKIIKIQ